MTDRTSLTETNRNANQGKALSASATEITPVQLPKLELGRRRNLKEVVHAALLVGLILSSLLMVIGVVVDLLQHRSPPATTVPIKEILHRVTSLRASGFLELGLLVLILTPLLRVVGSLLVFLYERDWRYAGFTALVLAIMVIGILAAYRG